MHKAMQSAMNQRDVQVPICQKNCSLPSSLFAAMEKNICHFLCQDWKVAICAWLLQVSFVVLSLIFQSKNAEACYGPQHTVFIYCGEVLLRLRCNVSVN